EGSMEKAFADLSRAIELNRSMPLAYILRGSAYSDRGEYSAAVADFSRAIELNSRSYSGYGGRAAAYVSLGDFPKARRDLAKAISLNPPQNDLKPLIRFRDSLPDQPRSRIRRDFERTPPGGAGGLNRRTGAAVES